MFLIREFRTDTNGRFKVGPLFPGVQHGKVYIGLNRSTDIGVAVKVERKNCKKGKLRHEIRAYDILHASNYSRTGIPLILFGGTLGHHRYLILDRLGESLERCRIACGGSISTKSVLMVAMRGLNTIRSIHEAGLLHCQIEPRNLLMGRYVHDESNVYAIDFGNAKRFFGGPPCDDEMPYSIACSPKSISLFTSFAYDSGLTLGRKHDLESFGYSLLYLRKGSLSWDVHSKSNPCSIPSRTPSPDHIHTIVENKRNMNLAKECEGLPPEMLRYFAYLNSLGTHAAPDYDLLISLFENAFFRLGYEDDCVYDWTPSFEDYPIWETCDYALMHQNTTREG